MEIQQSIFEQLFHSSKKLVTEYEYSSSENLKCTKTKNGTVLIKEDPETNGTLSYDILEDFEPVGWASHHADLYPETCGAATAAGGG